jgi:hypothetical protein
MWATEHETREEIVDRYRRVRAHSDATITVLAVDSPGYVPWWPRPDNRDEAETRRRRTTTGPALALLTERG